MFNRRNRLTDAELHEVDLAVVSVAVMVALVAVVLAWAGVR
jgi:hypothetical protein